MAQISIYSPIILWRVVGRLPFILGSSDKWPLFPTYTCIRALFTTGLYAESSSRSASGTLERERFSLPLPFLETVELADLSCKTVWLILPDLVIQANAMGLYDRNAASLLLYMLVQFFAL